MDPLTVLGLVCNIAQLVEFGFKIASKAEEIATSGTTSEHKHLQTLAHDALSLCNKWQSPVANRNPPCASSAALDDDNSKLVGQIKDVAGEITSMLQKLDIGERGVNAESDRPAKRRRLIASKVVKGEWKKKDLDRLRIRLVELQGQMTLRLLSQSPDQPLNTSRVTDQKMEEDLRRLVNLDRLLPALAPFVECDRTLRPGIEHLKVQARASVIGRVAQDSLAFEELDLREQSIPTPWAQTFSWIFSRQDLGFAKWLSEGQGVFWIYGKPGCGKSTLMKYIVQAKKTDLLLQQWAGEDKAIRAHYYFWYAGTEMQKSQIGLLRTLLFHIVRQFPVQAYPHLPARFRNGCALKDFSGTWTLQELHECVRSFGKNEQSSEGNRLCIFIDGLDEYEGEHLDLVDLLSTLSSCPRIKLCVASRPHNAFVRAYHKRATGQLGVQQLTEDDIRTFVQERLATEPLFVSMTLQDPQGCDQLIQQITDKAQGVFLWVHLVVRSLIRGLNNDDDLDVLQRRLADYPETLDGYFKRMFDRIEKVYRTQSARILLAVLNTPSALRFWAPRFLEVEMETPDYATMLNHDVDLELTGSQIASRDDGTNVAYRWLQTPTRARRFLDARSGDLLEIVDAPNRPLPQQLAVQFIHRTAHDFLQQTAMHEKLNELAGKDFEVGLSLAKLFLADAKLLSRLGQACSSSVKGMLYYDIPELIKHNHKPKLRPFVEQIDQIAWQSGKFDQKLSQYIEWVL